MPDSTTPTSTPVELSLLLPTDGSTTASLTGKKGDVGIARQFAYEDASDLAEAVLQAAWDLVELELNPPPLYDAPKPGKADRKAQQAAGKLPGQAATLEPPAAPEAGVEPEADGMVQTSFIAGE